MVQQHRAEGMDCLHLPLPHICIASQSSSIILCAGAVQSSIPVPTGANPCLGIYSCGFGQMCHEWHMPINGSVIQDRFLGNCPGNSWSFSAFLFSWLIRRKSLARNCFLTVYSSVTADLGDSVTSILSADPVTIAPLSRSHLGPHHPG